MQGKRTKFKADFKAKVALEALKGDKSTAELAQDLSGAPHPDRPVEEAAADVGGEPVRGASDQGRQRGRRRALQEDRQARDGARFFSLTARGQWSPALRREMIDPGHELSVSEQCRLLGVARSSYYRQRCGIESDENLALMLEIDRLYLAPPRTGHA